MELPAAPCGLWLLGAPGCSWTPKGRVLLDTKKRQKKLTRAAHLTPCGWCLGAPGCPWLLLAAPGCSWLLLVGPTLVGVGKHPDNAIAKGAERTLACTVVFASPGGLNRSTTRAPLSINPTSTSTGPETPALRLSLHLLYGTVFTVASASSVASVAHVLGPVHSPTRASSSLHLHVIMGDR